MIDLEALIEYRQQIKERQTDLEELEGKRLSMGGGIGRAGGNLNRYGAHFENYVAAYDKAYSELLQLTNRYVSEKLRLSRKIERLEDPDHADILYYRYIAGYTISALCERYDCSTRWLFRMLKRAKEEYERMEEENE